VPPWHVTSSHLSVPGTHRRWETEQPSEAQVRLLVCLYPTVLEEDALRALEELERMALLQTLRQTMGTEAGESPGEAGKALLGLWADPRATRESSKS
jgi:hypothetical protein